MEAQLQKDSKRAEQCEEEKLQLEEDVPKLRWNVREMKNTLEKYTASIQVNKLLVEARSGFSMHVQENSFSASS